MQDMIDIIQKKSDHLNEVISNIPKISSSLPDLNLINQNLASINKINFGSYFKNYEIALNNFQKIDFAKISNQLVDISDSLPDYSKIINNHLESFVKLSNSLNFDYFSFYNQKFNFKIGDFENDEDKLVAENYEKNIADFDVEGEKFFEKIKEDDEVELNISFKQCPYFLLDKFKKVFENQGYKKMWNKEDNCLNKLPESIAQDELASYFSYLEEFFNQEKKIFFRFHREVEIWKGGRVDFIFEFKTLFQEFAVEIKIIKKEKDLDYFGTNQLLDYMKRKNIQRGVRLVFNATKKNMDNFENNNIIHYFVNVKQLVSSSLN